MTHLSSACRFLPDGSVLDPTAIEETAWYLGVGGIQHPQVFDHHCPGLPPKTTPAALIWAQRERLMAQSARLTDHITLICHRHPHWNTCWAATLLLDLLAGQRPDATQVEAFNTFAAFVLAGHNPVEGAVERSPLAIFEGLMGQIEEEESADPDQRDERKLREGIGFFRYLQTRVDDYAALKRDDLIDEVTPYGDLLPRVRADHQIYLRDLQRGRRFRATLAHRNGTRQLVDGLFLDQPVARLFKFWARGDRVHSQGQAGFPLTWVRWSSSRSIISVDPASGYALEGLGDALTAAETRRHPPPPDEPPRDGYSVPDPWFDGRGTPIAFTLIDSPRAGSHLSPRQLERVLRTWLRIRQWHPALSRPQPGRTRWLPLTASLVVSIVLPMLGWNLTQRSDASCPHLSDPSPLAVTEGRHYAIAIGINAYASPQWPSLGNAVADAQRVMEVLTEHYGFVPLGQEGSQLLLSGNPDESLPTRQNIRHTVQRVAEQLTDQDALVIYYAGHGEQDRSFGYWVPEDAENQADLIDQAWLHQILRVSAARHVLVIADACYAGRVGGDEGEFFADAGKEPRPLLERLLGKPTRGNIIAPPPKPDQQQQQLYQRPSRQLFSSGYIEPVPDGAIDHSPFALCLIEQLKDHILPYLSVGELFYQVRDCTQNEDFGIQQRIPEPKFLRLRAACDGQGELVLRRRPAPSLSSVNN